MTEKTVCQSCDVLVINGVICHEQGCPDSYKTNVRECKWCGSEFIPQFSRQCTCSDECWSAYMGYDYAGEEQE